MTSVGTLPEARQERRERIREARQERRERIEEARDGAARNVASA